MSVRFYTDEHVSNVVVRALRQRGVGVLTVAEAGTLGETDEAHLRRAYQEGRVLFSQDQDFLALHARGVRHSGIAYAPRQAPFRRVLDGLLLIHAVLDAEEMAGRLEFLGPLGDPLKGTSGPSLNILIKLIAVVALVIAPLIV